MKMSKLYPFALIAFAAWCFGFLTWKVWVFIIIIDFIIYVHANDEHEEHEHEEV